MLSVLLEFLCGKQAHEKVWNMIKRPKCANRHILDFKKSSSIFEEHKFLPNSGNYRHKQNR